MHLLVKRNFDVNKMQGTMIKNKYRYLSGFLVWSVPVDYTHFNLDSLKQFFAVFHATSSL
jgi:hypothetical protein